MLKFLPASLLAALLVCPTVHASPLTTAPGAFATDYSYVDPNTPNGGWDPGTYTSTTAIGGYHDLWASPSTPDGSAFLVFNALDDQPVQTAWRVTTSVQRGTSYLFTALVANLCCSTDLGFPAALLSLLINGVETQIVTDGAGVFVPVAIWFESGDHDNVEIELRNARSVYQGADYAFANPDLAPTPTPEPPAALLLLSGLLFAGGFVLRRSGFVRPSL